MTMNEGTKTALARIDAEYEQRNQARLKQQLLEAPNFIVQEEAAQRMMVDSNWNGNTLEVIMPKKTPQFDPNDDLVLVELLVSEKTTSGLYIPPSSQEDTTMGTVREVGAVMEWNGISFSTGDIVVFASTSGKKVSVDGVSRVALRRSEILFRVRWEDEENE